MELTKSELKLATEIAQKLDDMDSIEFHKGLVKQYSESYLKDRLAIVLRIPKDKIRTSRAAYYNYLVTSNVKQKKNYPRD